MTYPEWLSYEYERRMEARAARRFGAFVLALYIAVVAWAAWP